MDGFKITGMYYILVQNSLMVLSVPLVHAVKSFTELGPQLLTLPGVKYLLSEVFSQDPFASHASVIVEGVMRTPQQIRSLTMLQHWCNSSECIEI